MEFDYNANEIIRKYDKSSFFVGCDNQRDQENVILKNEIILCVIIRRGSGPTVKYRGQTMINYNLNHFIE